MAKEGKQPPGQERSRQQTQERPAERSTGQKTEPQAEYAVETITSTVQDTNADTKQKPAVELGERKITAGRAGERNIAIEWISVPVGIHISARFNVKTLAGNGLEVTLEQSQYKKTFAGQGTVATTVIPVAPIGTTGKLIVRDVTTGEIAEQPWKWRLIGQGMGLWAFIKRLLGFG